MSKLIEQFLETHRQCTAQNSVFNISPILDQEASAIIEQAQAETQKRVRGKTAVFATLLPAVVFSRAILPMPGLFNFATLHSDFDPANSSFSLRL